MSLSWIPEELRSLRSQLAAKDAELAKLREQVEEQRRRLEGAERLFSCIKVNHWLQVSEFLFIRHQDAWEGASEGWYLVQYPTPVAKLGPYASPIDCLEAAIAANWLPSTQESH